MFDPSDVKLVKRDGDEKVVEISTKICIIDDFYKFQREVSDLIQKYMI